MSIERANIETVRWSKIRHDVVLMPDPNREIGRFRRANLTITDMIWITKSPVVDSCYNLFNPKDLIIIILN